MDWLSDPQAWIALATLSLLEIVLGIDNIVFLSILTDRLPPEQRKLARRIGLLLAMAMRVGLLFALSWIRSLTEPLFEVAGHGIAGRNLILLAGGLFLIGKSTLEIHHRIEDAGREEVPLKATTFGAVLVQVMLLDVVFSLDSVITAVGMVDELGVMVTAVLLSVVVMILFVDVVCAFIERHPTFKILALSFLILIGVALVGEGLPEELGFAIEKAYIYFAMGFAVCVEMVNTWIRSKSRAAAEGGEVR